MADTGAKVCGTVEAEAWSSNFTTAVINSSNNVRAWALGVSYKDAEISDFAFGVPAGATIDGIAVVAEFSSSYAGFVATIAISLSYDDGVNYTAPKENTVTSTIDESKTYGGAADTWGRAWSAAEFADGTFRIKVQGKTDSADRNCRLDYLYAIVYYTEAAGGTGMFIQFF